jgi:hypothetical protein
MTEQEWKPTIGQRVLYQGFPHIMFAVEPDAFGSDVLVAAENGGAMKWIGSCWLTPEPTGD